jgi:phosphohistidine swiveling domain-containing protein
LSFILKSGSRKDIGGKASALSRLDAAGLPVPEWFAIAPAAFEASLDGELCEALAQGNVERLRVAIAELTPSTAVTQEISAALETLPGAKFAVRSSATDEDGAEDSFAGQLASFLFVDREAIAARVADVWRSGFTSQIVEYRRQRGLAPSPVAAPAVLVQRMIDPDSAGVAFSADPVSGRRGTAIVSAVFGAGTALVGGEADADAYEVTRQGTVEHETIAHKTIRHAFAAETREGVAAEALPDEMRDRRVLSADQAAGVAKLARDAVAVFGLPQDIEWAIADGKAWLLQSRPITTLHNLPDPDGVLNIWDNSNIIESYSGVTTPLTFSFARHVYHGVYRQFCRILSVPAAKIAANEQTFSNMLGLFHGRVYYNLLNWYRVLALLPGFTFNRRFMEQMMGVRETLPDEITASLASATRGQKAADFLSLIKMLCALAASLAGLERQVARFEARLNHTLRDPISPLAQMRLDELIAYYTQLEEKLLQHWDAPLVNDFFAMIFHGALRKLTAAWVGDANGMLANDAIRGQEGMVSAEPAARVRELATIAAHDAEMVRCLCDGSNDESLRAVRQHPEFCARFNAYLAKFGDRCLEELKLESETLDENPAVLLRSIGHFARALAVESETPRTTAMDAGREAEMKIRTALARTPFKRLTMMWILRQARTRVRNRENLRLERTRLFGRVRRIFRECGKRLHASGVLELPRDIFYLQVEEIVAWVNGGAATVELDELAALRKAEFAKYRTLPAPPDRFETRGAVYAPQGFQPSAAPAADVSGKEERRGIGCCPGVVRGTARVILDPRGATLPAGCILVAEHTDPGWIMLFPSAKGLLVERGSLLSHSAIVARELGIPAVVSIAGLTRWLCDGDEVELDGAAGTVRRLEKRGPDGE